MDNSNLTTTCTSCGAPLTPVAGKDYFICHYCGAFYFPQASRDGVKILGEPASRICPVCKIPLVTAAIEEIHVQACARCRGVMVNQDQLAFIINTLRLNSNKMENILPLDRADLNQVRVCQTCGRTMDTHAYEGGGNIVIDVCARCGIIWFDYGEIKRIISSPDIGINRSEMDVIDHFHAGPLPESKTWEKILKFLI